MVYQSLCGLMPLMVTSGGAAGGGQARGPPYIKLTVPVVELTSQAVRSTLAILEEVSTETVGEVKSSVYVCVHVCACVYVCMCMCVCMCVHVCAYMCVRTCCVYVCD